MDHKRELRAPLKHEFKNTALLTTALTHSSYANENREGNAACNERLEFLGDSVLNMVAADYLFGAMGALPEGELTKMRAALVCEASLYKIARAIELGGFLILGRGEEQNGGRLRQSILADAVEAVIAALYLDGGIGAVKAFVVPFLKAETENMKSGAGFKDYKTALQEVVQRNKQETLRYELTGESGPDHDKRFHVTLYISEKQVANGEGRSKKEAEQNAAMKALEFLREL